MTPALANLTGTNYSLHFMVAGLIMLFVSLDSFLRRKTHFYAPAFAWACLTLTLWLLGTGLGGLTITSFWHGLFNGLHQLGVMFIPTAFLYFSATFLKKYHVFPRRTMRLIVVFSAAFFVLALNPNWGLVTGVNHYAFGNYPRYGPVGFAYLLFFLLVMGYAFAMWWQAYHQELDQIRRKRMILLGVAFLLSGSGAVNFLPSFGVALFPFGYLNILFSVGFAAYAIYIYKSSPFRIILQSLAAYLVAIIAGLLLWYGLIVEIHGTVHQFVPRHVLAVLAGIIPAILIIYLLPQHLIRLRHQRQLDLQGTVLDSIIQLQIAKKCAGQIVRLSREMIKSQDVKVILLDQFTMTYELLDQEEQGRLLDHEEQIGLDCLRGQNAMLVWEELNHRMDAFDQQEALLALFVNYDAQIILPIVHGQTVYAVFLIGRLRHKLVLKPYQMTWFDRLLPYALGALTNAYIYEQMRQLSHDLWEANINLNGKISKRTTTLEAALEKMQALYGEQSNFFTMALHNIRTPLTSISAASTILRRSCPDKDKESIYRILTNNIERLNTLALDIIEIAKIDKGQEKYRHLRFDINELVTEVFENISQKYYDKHILWNYVQTENIRYINAESHQIKLVLHHLISNAFKFSNIRDSVELTLKMATGPDLIKYGLGSIESPGDFYEFTVSDTGPGIPPDIQHQLFDSFVKGINAQSDFESTGLGLYVVKRIIENYGGAVVFKSVPKKGTVVSFILPV